MLEAFSMELRVAVIRYGKEIRRVNGVDGYLMQLEPKEHIFFDENRNEIARLGAEIGDVVQPVVVGFYNPFPPIDQSLTRIAELHRKYEDLTGTRTL
jgi:hypothetical protein